MSAIATKDELLEQLSKAEERALSAEAAIQANGENIDPEVLAELEAEHEEAVAEMARARSAVERTEARQEALKLVPRLEKDEKSDSGVRVGRTPLTYRPREEGGAISFFQDMIRHKRGDFEAGARLQRHMKEMQVERRDMTTSATDGGEFVPPAHLQDRWAELARSSRIYANVIPSLGAPPAKSFTLPKVTTGTLTAIVDGENAAISEQDAVTAELTFNTKTIAGMVDLSIQSLDFSTPGLDEVVASDLARDYATKLDVQLLNGTNANGQVQGVLQNSNVESVTYTDATPTVAELYSKLADAVQRVATLRFAAAEAIFMHPRRWGWITAAADTAGRPLIPPVAPQNAGGTFGITDQGAVGSLQGLPVFLDANLPTTLGAGTN
jgi:HK97 family phage major capsid protein